jgi:hypothetical protein
MRRGFRYWFAVLCCLIPLAPLRADEPAVLDGLIGGADLWTSARADFVNNNAPLGFAWNSAAEDVAQSRQKSVTFLTIPVYEAIARFEADKPKEIVLSFYNRGDAGELTREQFEALLRKCVDALSAYTKTKPVVLGRDAANTVKAERVRWQTADTALQLEYSFTREMKSMGVPFRAEFVRLRISPIEKPKSLVQAALAARTTTQFSGPSHLKRNADGDAVIEGIPMVDQGQKGYCVVATAERVMRYYGRSVDEHELAQIANSSASAGTSNKAMFESLQKLSSRLHVKTRVIEPFGQREIMAMVNEYNRLAAQGKRSDPVNLDTASDLAEVYGQMKPDVLRDARTKNKSDMHRFFRAVTARVDEGIPLLWSVMMGVVPEEKMLKRPGGHTRLIIGYNAKTEEVLYSDSWGAGNELKRMPLADAWTITTGVNTIEPL